MHLEELLSDSSATKSISILAAGGLVWSDQNGTPEIVLVKQKSDGQWHLPKGKYSSRDKTIEDAAVREVKEETGCEVKPYKFAGSLNYTAKKKKKLVLFWHMKLKKKNVAKIHDDITEHRWFPVKKALEKLSFKRERQLLAEQMTCL